MKYLFKLFNSINTLISEIQESNEAVAPDLWSFLQEHHQILHFFPNKIQKVGPIVMNPWKKIEW